MSKPQPQLDTDDALNPKFNASALDLLLIELVPLAQRITEQTLAREQILIDEYKRSKILNPQPQSRDGENNVQVSGDSSAQATSLVRDGANQGSSTAGVDKESVTSLGFPPVSEDTREGMFWHLDGLGYRVGQGLVERFSANKPRPQTPLDSIKFVCKDLWLLIFRKQIDNLKTNHRGIYVLTDNRFQPLGRMSVDRRGAGGAAKAVEEALARAQLYLYFPCGVIRGALQGLGIDAVVSAESTELPTATFQIKTKGAKA